MTDTKNNTMFEMHGAQIRLGNRKIGWTTWTSDGKKIYVSPRNRLGITKQGVGHRMQIFDAYGIAECVLDFLERNKFDEIHLKIGMSKTLISEVKDWREKGFPYHRPPFEKQIMLKEKFMKRKTLTLSQLTK